MKKVKKEALLLTLILMLSLIGLISPTLSYPLVTSRNYTLNADFDEGVLVGLEHDTIPDQLQLSTEHITLPFIWVPNNEGTVSKVNTETGDELGRYWVSPDPEHIYYPGVPASPSRTTVDLQGNCWVGCRDAGTVVKIGLYEAGQYIDRNGDGIIQTSRDLNEDGDITGEEILPWGQDECVLFEVVLYVNESVTKGPYVPGTFPGPYDTKHWRTSPRGLAIDAANNLWAGTCPTGFKDTLNCIYHYIDGDTGEILHEVEIPGHYAYGAVIDENGILWSSNRPTSGGTPHLLRFDTTDYTYTKLLSGRMTYGIGLDHLGNLFFSGWTQSRLNKIDTNTNNLLWSTYDSSRLYQARGVACTSDNNIWVASSYWGTVSRYDNNGAHLGTFEVGSTVVSVPTGVSVDAEDNVWVCNDGDDFIRRINTNSYTVDLVKEIIGSNGHYSYSDMTGIIARTITTRIGTWKVIFDCEESNKPWGKLTWNGEQPEGTTISVKVRSSEDQSTWSSWEEASNGVSLSSTPNGRYLEIETTLQILEGEISPILYDLTVEVGNRPPIADAGEDQTYEQTSFSGAEVTLDGSGSMDPDGDTLTYSWSWAGGSTSGMNPTVIFPLGATTITLEVSDGYFSDTDTVVITIIDTTPPEISIREEPIILWPPNHEYHIVSVYDFVTSVSDICDAGVSINDVVITTVTSNEPDDARGGGDGNTTNDIIILDCHTVLLRAERQGGGNGRIYTINFEVTDISGNTATGTFEVWVPHDLGFG